jgi:hypothetical protein
MDVVTGLPCSNGYNMIWVVIDHQTKLQDFTHCSMVIDAEGLAKLFLSNVFHIDGLTDTIFSD